MLGRGIVGDTCYAHYNFRIPKLKTVKQVRVRIRMNDGSEEFGPGDEDYRLQEYNT
jgi:hypothetical protein